MASAAVELHTSGMRQWDAASSARGCAHGGSWRERDASVKVRTLPRQTMGDDATGGGLEFAEQCWTGQRERSGSVKLTGLFRLLCVLCCVYVTNSARMEVRENACGSRAAAALPSTWHNPLPCANIHKQVRGRPWLLGHLYRGIFTWSEVK